MVSSWQRGGVISGATNNDLWIYSFNRAAGTLTEVTSVAVDGGTGNTVNSVNWSPDGQYLAVGGDIVGGTTGNDLWIYTGINFPNHNVITNNTVYCNSGAQFPSGVGISGPSICNLIIGNTAYSNPMPQSANHPIVSTNYYFVCNVFNQLFGQAPFDLQNIALGGCEPIVQPLDVGLLAQQILYNVTTLSGCGSTRLTSANISAGTITLSSPGNYCLSTDLTTDITITTTCVTLDLNDRCLTGVISVSTAEEVIIRNGYVTPAAPTSAPAAAITINTSAVRVTVDDVSIVCADTATASIAGRNGIDGNGNYAQILNSTIKTGAGGSNGAGAGSNGGTGIAISGATGVSVLNCTIIQTGNGGDGSTTNGNGGTGITIASSCANTYVRNCTIHNTGSAGAGAGAAGTAGYAILDSVSTAANYSLVYANFASKIANAIKYNLQGSGLESGVLLPNPPTAAVINPYANVYAS